MIVSTVREAEALEPLVRAGTVRDILYGVPLPPSAAPRLAALRARHPALAVALLVDHAAQLPRAGAWRVFVKLDNGYARAGVVPGSPALAALLAAVAAADGIALAGFYSHAGHAYASASAAESLGFLAQELDTVLAGAAGAPAGLVLSVGATPTALAADPAIADMVARIQERWVLELHAGVYTTLDLQQLAPRPNGLGVEDIALTIMGEVASVYPERGEVLVAFGSTALGREPPGASGAYPGWALVTGWEEGKAWAGERGGWVVGRISQEHAVLTRDEDFAGEAMQLEVGQKIRVWPQHSCIAGNGHGWYFVTEDGETVSDVYVRWRGW